MKDMNSKNDLYRANAIRVLCRIIDSQMLLQIERYLKQVGGGVLSWAGAGVGATQPCWCRWSATSSSCTGYGALDMRGPTGLQKLQHGCWIANGLELLGKPLARGLWRWSHLQCSTLSSPLPPLTRRPWWTRARWLPALCWRGPFTWCAPAAAVLWLHWSACVSCLLRVQPPLVSPCDPMHAGSMPWPCAQAALSPSLTCLVPSPSPPPLQAGANAEVIKRWTNEVQEAINSRHPMVRWAGFTGIMQHHGILTARRLCCASRPHVLRLWASPHALTHLQLPCAPTSPLIVHTPQHTVRSPHPTFPPVLPHRSSSTRWRSCTRCAPPTAWPCPSWSRS